ncbi:hypothetical protein LTR50_004855 [Elasticomyces elasticus]|nr:hypothetical protein LTR50_004855 [Elasticomyces elasticus]
MSGPLPPGWTQHTAPTGHAYYYNAETKHSTYTRPTLQPPPPPMAALTQPLHYNPEQNVIPPEFLAATTHHAINYGGRVPSAYQSDYPHQHIQEPRDLRGRGGLRSGRDGFDRRRQLEDRPKSKHTLPGCAPLVLVKTKLGRRFVHNTETNESLWRFPDNVRHSVTEFDRLEREREVGKEGTGANDVPLGTKRQKTEEEMQREDEEALAAELAQEAEKAEEAAEGDIVTVAPRPSFAPAPAVNRGREAGDSSSEYEEIEVTDDEGEEDGADPKSVEATDNPPSAENGPVEFNEDDIAYQLAAMGADYGLDPGEYDDGNGAEGWADGAEGLPLTEEDSTALFRDLLDDYGVDPYTLFDRVVEDGQIIEDERYTTLETMRARREVYDAWAKDKMAVLKAQREKQMKLDPRIPYLAFLEQHATPKLYWPEFRRKFKREPEMKSTAVSDKDREKLYREHITRLKLPLSTLKSDLSTLLKSIPLALLNHSMPLAALPPQMLTDIRYISLPPATRDPLIVAYISTLAPPPADGSALSAEEEAAQAKEHVEKLKRDQALEERKNRVEEEKRKQERERAHGRGRLREEEREIRKAMVVGKGGLRSYLQEAVADDVSGREERETVVLEPV